MSWSKFYPSFLWHKSFESVFRWEILKKKSKICKKLYRKNWHSVIWLIDAVKVALNRKWRVKKSKGHNTQDSKKAGCYKREFEEDLSPLHGWNTKCRVNFNHYRFPLREVYHKSTYLSDIGSYGTKCCNMFVSVLI